VKKHLTAIRIIACLIWTTAGLISGGLAGYLSAAATLMFLYTIVVDNKTQVLEDRWKATGKDLELIGFQLGIPRKQYSVMGVKVNEPEYAYRKRMLEHIRGVKGPRGL
jgi:hypothetical protein